MTARARWVVNSHPIDKRIKRRVMPLRLRTGLRRMIKRLEQMAAELRAEAQ